MKAFEGRHTARIEDDFVVFLIGAHVNTLWRVWRWWPVLKAMRPMVLELQADTDSGLLSAHTGWMFGGPTLVQYWRSFEHLERYARDAEAKHLPAWRDFNRRLRGTTAVGVFHETYRVRAEDHEAVYVDMPRIGLACASTDGPVPVGSTSTAARRIGARPGDLPPIEP
jgi:hypothetical protein